MPKIQTPNAELTGHQASAYASTAALLSDMSATSLDAAYSSAFALANCQHIAMPPHSWNNSCYRLLSMTFGTREHLFFIPTDRPDEK
jgi:hypothetical protein